MKKDYIKPNIEIIYIDNFDVITASKSGSFGVLDLDDTSDMDEFHF